MKVICSKENLIEGISIVQKAVSSKTTLPILEGILLECNDAFKLTGNDLEIGIECFIEADIQKKGSVVINSKMLGDIIRRLPDAEVLIELKDNNLIIIECENSHFEIKGLSPAGYPALPSIKKENALIVSQKLIRDMIRQTVFAVSIDENRPILTGSLIEYKDNELVIVSIDGFRMALRKNPINIDAQDFSVVVPGKTLNEIVKILQPIDEDITIYNSNNQILFDIGKCKVVSRLLEGKFLNYNSLINKDFETKVRVCTKEFLSSMERASLIAMNERNNPIKIKIGEDKITITSHTEVGAAREEVRVNVEGKELEIGYNPTYMIEALKAIEDEFIDVYFITSNAPCTIRPIENDKYAYLIQAIRI